MKHSTAVNHKRICSKAILNPKCKVLLKLLVQTLLQVARSYKLTLVGRDGTERTTAKATTVDVDRVLNHLIGGNGFVFIAGVAFCIYYIIPFGLCQALFFICDRNFLAVRYATAKSFSMVLLVQKAAFSNLI